MVGAGNVMMMDGTPNPIIMLMGAKASWSGDLTSSSSAVAPRRTVGDNQRCTASQRGATHAKPTMATASPKKVVLYLNI